MKIVVHSKGKKVYAVVDLEDFSEISTKHWTLNQQGYAVRGTKVNGKWRALMMHRQITNAPPGVFVDHVNRDKLDNRKSNLRLVPKSVNELNKPTAKNNRSGHRGVVWEERIKRWRAFGSQHGKRKSLGSFKVFEDAVISYHDFVLGNNKTLYCCK